MLRLCVCACVCMHSMKEVSRNNLSLLVCLQACTQLTHWPCSYERFTHTHTHTRTHTYTHTYTHTHTCACTRSVQDSHHLFVLWSCHETNLESFRGPASLHASIIQGVDVITFNHDRTKGMTHTHTHTHTDYVGHTYTHTHTHTHRLCRAHIHTCPRARTNIHTHHVGHTYTHARARRRAGRHVWDQDRVVHYDVSAAGAHTHTYTHTYAPMCEHACICARTRVGTHTPTQCAGRRIKAHHLWMYVCVCVCVYSGGGESIPSAYMGGATPARSSRGAYVCVCVCHVLCGKP